MSRKASLDPTQPTKYEQPLPPAVLDFMAYHDRWQAHQENPDAEAEQWWLELVEVLKGGIIERFQAHWKESSKVRKVFVTMNPDVVWENEEEKIIRVTRRNLGSMDRPFITALETYIHDHIKGMVDPIREELRGIVIAVFASEEERGAIETFTSGESFLFEDLGQHLVEQQAWSSELFQRFPLIQWIREYEMFLLSVVVFEEENRNSSSRNERIGNHNVNAKYRTLASQTISESFDVLRELIDTYQSTYNKAFEIKGSVYQHTLDSQMKCVARVKTNFSSFNRDVLLLFVKDIEAIEPITVDNHVANLLEVHEDRYQFVEFVDHTRGVLE